MSQLITLVVAMVLIVLAEGQDACIGQNCTQGNYCTNNRCEPCEHLLALCENTPEMQKYPTCLQTCDGYNRSQQMKALEQNLTEKLAITNKQLQEAVQSNAVLNKTISALKYKYENEIKNITEQLANTTNQLQEEERNNDKMTIQLRKERIAFSVALSILSIILIGAVICIIKLCYNYAENRRGLVPVPMENTILPDNPRQQNGSFH